MASAPPEWMEEPSPPPSSSTSTAGTPYSETPTWLTTDANDGTDPQQPQQPLEIVTLVDESATTTAAPDDNEQNNAAERKTWGEYWRDSFRRDGRLILITVLIIVLMNVPYVQWALYPFTVFSTWIHELCHGLAAVMAGGSISKLEIFPDTSGLAYTVVNPNRRGFVSSAGYQGTAVIGMLLLLVRRTKRGPRSGTMGVAIMMILSVILWVRNPFGVCFILLLGFLLALAAWRLPSGYMRNLYVCLAVTCSLNAITSARNLYGSNHVVNGQESSTDAHTMADLKGGSAAVWATVWLVLALLLTLAGILFAIPGPDEVADFTLCGVCQDCGLFTICNLKGQRIFSKLFGKKDGDSDTATNTNDATNTV